MSPLGPLEKEVVDKLIVDGVFRLDWVEVSGVKTFRNPIYLFYLPFPVLGQ